MLFAEMCLLNTFLLLSKCCLKMLTHLLLDDGCRKRRSRIASTDSLEALKDKLTKENDNGCQILLLFLENRE